jgi:hypothetical protein
VVSKKLNPSLTTA